MIDLSKLMICNGVIHYKIRQQDRETFVWMKCKDSKENRMFVTWLQTRD